MRAIGCGSLGAVAFVALGVLSILRAGAPAECPGALPYQLPGGERATYEPVGAPMPSPSLQGVEGTLERGSEVAFGLAKWTVYLPPGTAPTSSDVALPPRIVLDCHDGTFQAFQRETA